MTLQASGTISLTDVMNELRVTNSGRSYPISLGDADVRALAGIASGDISLSNLYGKSSYIAMTLSALGSTGYALSTYSGSVSCTPSVTVSNGTAPYTYQWDIAASVNSPTLTNATQAMCTVSHGFGKGAQSSASMTLQITVTDATGHTAVVGGIMANLSWDSNA